MNVYEKIDIALGKWVKKGLTPSHIVVHRSIFKEEDMKRLGDSVIDHNGYSIDILVSNHDHVRYGEVFCTTIIENLKRKTFWQRLKCLVYG